MPGFAIHGDTFDVQYQDGREVTYRLEINADGTADHHYARSEGEPMLVSYPGMDADGWLEIAEIELAAAKDKVLRQRAFRNALHFKLTAEQRKGTVAP